MSFANLKMLDSFSTLSQNPYEGADPNLQQHFDKNIVQYTRLPATYEPKPMETLCYGFVSMLYHLLCEKTHLPNYEQVCRYILA